MNYNSKKINLRKNFYILIAGMFVCFSSCGQSLTGTNIYIAGSSSSAIYQGAGNDNSGISINPNQAYISTSIYPGGSYTANSFVETETTGVNIGSSGTVDLFVGAVDPISGSISGSNSMSISSAYTAMSSYGSGSSTVAMWASNPSVAITSANGLLANSSGTYLQSATNLILTGSEITLNGNTNINATGNNNTTIGNVTGIVAIAGSAVNIGSNNGSTISLGSSSGNSTINLNGNRLQNVGAGILGTDAVNLNQVNSLISNTSNQITSLQNQVDKHKSGISSAAALANIPSLSTSQKNNIGIGIGSFQGITAIAFGSNFRIKENLIGKLSASLSAGNVVTGAGLSLGW